MKFRKVCMEKAMKRFLTSVVGIFMILFMQTGCGKASHNGDLDGQWQVMEVIEGSTPVIFPEGERFYYLFYLHTFQLGFTDKRPFGLVGNMSYDKSTLGLDFPLIREGRVSPEWIRRLRYWGLPETGDAVLQIREINSQRLVMQRDSVTVVCRKF